MDYITKPFDPSVLRAKVSVSVELWAKSDQLRAAADSARSLEAELTATRAGVREAIDLLREAVQAADAGKLGQAAGEAIDLLGAVRT